MAEIYFNPRSRKGSDYPKPFLKENQFDFNPRSRKGSDLKGAGFESEYYIFQSTLPQGERRKYTSAWYAAVPTISIHAPARGATRQRTRLPLPGGNFNPRSRKGSDSFALLAAL